MHPLRVTVEQKHHWTIFFENERGLTITVNADMYSTIITDFFVLAFHGIDVNVVWFQQDNVTYYTSHATINLLRQTFNGRLIRREGDVNFFPKSCDFKTLDYFLWRVICYAGKWESIEHLKDNIRITIAEIRQHILEKVHELL